MNADVGFGWIVFAGFLLWVFQVLRAGGQGGVRRGPGSEPRVPRPDPTQREGQQLDQMLRQLETRLSQQQARRAGQTPAKPAPRARPRIADAGEAASLEAPVDREAEAEALERKRLAEVAARDDALTDADHAAFEARVRAQDAAAAKAPIHRLAARQLRDAFVWSEILAPPIGLRQ